MWEFQSSQLPFLRSIFLTFQLVRWEEIMITCATQDKESHPAISSIHSDGAREHVLGKASTSVLRSVSKTTTILGLLFKWLMTHILDYYSLNHVNKLRLYMQLDTHSGHWMPPANTESSQCHDFNAMQNSALILSWSTYSSSSEMISFSHTNCYLSPSASPVQSN